MPRKKGMWGEGTCVLGCSSAVEHFCNICEALGSFTSTQKSTWCYSWRKTTGGLSLGAVSCPRPLSLLPATPMKSAALPTACPYHGDPASQMEPSDHWLTLLKPGTPRNHSFFKFSLSALCHGDGKTAKLFSSWQLPRSFLCGFLFNLLLYGWSWVTQISVLYIF